MVHNIYALCIFIGFLIECDIEQDMTENSSLTSPPSWSISVAGFLNKFRWAMLVVGGLLTYLAILSAGNLKVSTKLEALMPEGANSVLTLNRAMEKAGSFAAIQVIFRGLDDKEISKEVLDSTVERFQKLSWADSVQSFEDLTALERHKLLLLDEEELENIDHRLVQEIVDEMASSISGPSGIPIRITLNNWGVSSRQKDEEKGGKSLADDLAQTEGIEAKQTFVSDDGLSRAVIIWPKSGNEGLGAAKMMIEEVAVVLTELGLDNDPSFRVGIAGRIRNKVAQYDAVLNDVVVGLGSSVALILLVIVLSYRRFISIPLIIIPLVIGIIWTIGLTTVIVGGLNLITIFLALILFGLGIDFGIHNLSRYLEARKMGIDHIGSIAQVIGNTGTASLVAAITTAASFYALTLTDFRAFREFGLIAGSGILLIFLSMYTIFPALVSILQNFISTKPLDKKLDAQNQIGWLSSVARVKATLVITVCSITFMGYYAVNLGFEKNFKNIQAERSLDHKWATLQSKDIFKGGHDRAILLVNTLDEVKKIEAYFEEYIKKDTETPTVKMITSIRNFLPEKEIQANRLRIIERMRKRLEEVGAPDELKDKIKYLEIDGLDIDELPEGLRRAFLGNEAIPGYLMYIFNSVTMDDADLAKQFYDDVAQFTVDGITYYPASESFVFVEMIALMKDDAVKAILLVLLVTYSVLLIFSRSFMNALIMITPPFLCLLFTVGIMSIFGIKLSIINMVILPSIIGISVDNSIHLFERFMENPGGQKTSDIMGTTGIATTITTLTTLLGFSGLLLASMGGLRSMGLVAVIGFLISLILTWTVLPALLNHLSFKHEKKIVYDN